MSLWRHESSSCRKPRLSTEHCCRLHTLAIFCRPPGPASAAAPRTPSRVARGRARTRGPGVEPPARGGAGAGAASPRGGPGVAPGRSGPARLPRALHLAASRAAVPAVRRPFRRRLRLPETAPSHGRSWAPPARAALALSPKAMAAPSLPGAFCFLS
ncbi:PREDICTED: transcription initiation factor TFIID subunit 4 [Propithecus coquereli]|uniref:transcription initiation factor TFIID subunit 4 n=1 Tax=Propithecus coquereli TaxID=379532 RepID=UPI00063F3CFB|nr:PREDICTED: transcription initiation factor TFIID subunit 4 [Propithecus coquereli]